MRTGAAETKQHTAPNSPKCNQTKSMRLYPDTRKRSNKSIAPTGTTEALGKPPAPETLPGPEPPPPPPTPAAHQQYNTYHTVEISTVPQDHALPYNYLAVRNARGSPKMLLWHRKRATHPAKTTSNSEPAGTTAATGSPNSANGHGGASERRESGFHVRVQKEYKR